MIHIINLIIILNFSKLVKLKQLTVDHSKKYTMGSGREMEFTVNMNDFAINIAYIAVAINLITFSIYIVAIW